MTSSNLSGLVTEPGQDGPPTDSRREGSESDSDRFGIDTVDVLFRTTPDVFANLPLQRLRIDTDTRTGVIGEPRATTSEVQLPSGLLLRAVHRGGGPGVLVSLSIPRWLRGDNTLPASADETRAVLNALTDEVQKYVSLSSEHPQVLLRRVDIARDFIGVPAPHLVLEALSHHRPQRTMTTSLFRDVTLVGAQTVYRRNSRWGARVYHRGPMYLEKAKCTGGDLHHRLADSEHGTVRFEVELRGRVLGESALVTPADLDDRRLRSLAQRYWERTCFGARSGSDAGRLRAAIEALRPADLRLVYSYVGLRAHISPPMARATERKAKALAERFDLRPEDLNAAGSAPSGRLDLASGRFVQTT